MLYFKIASILIFNKKLQKNASLILGVPLAKMPPIQAVHIIILLEVDTNSSNEIRGL